MSWLESLRLGYLWLRHKLRSAEEIDYWETYLAGKPHLMFLPDVKERAFPPFLSQHLADLGADESPPTLLEVGSGPASLLIDGVEKGLLAVTAVDPLAETYARLLEKNGIDYPIAPRPGHAESLDKHFAPGSFDLVYSSNALDHALAPRICLEQMWRVLRPGGRLFLEGFVREGSSGDWHGLHQHDLYLEGERLMHQPRGGGAAHLAEGLALDCLFAETCQFKKRGILSYGYEIPENIDPAKNWNDRDWFMIGYRKP